MMENCIFCKIVKGEVSSNKIYETDRTLVFLDANPISKGHSLIISKEHHEDIFNIDEGYLKDIIITAKELSKKMKRNLGVSGVNILHASGKDAQQSVFHFHIHLVPRYENDGLNAWPKSDYKQENFEEIANKIRGKS